MSRTQPRVAGEQTYTASHYVAGSAGKSIYAQATSTRATDAAQFMPFAALTGYYATVREQELELGAEPRRTLAEERAEEVSRMLARLRKGDQVLVTHYGHDRYLTTTGTVRQVDSTFRRLELVGAQRCDTGEDGATRSLGSSAYSASAQSAGTVARNASSTARSTTTRILFEDIWELTWIE